MGHLLFTQQRLAHFDDVSTLLWSLLHLTSEKEAGRSHDPAAELPETLDHVEPMEEHHSCSRSLIATGHLSGKTHSRYMSPVHLHAHNAYILNTDSSRIQSQRIAGVYDQTCSFPAVADLRRQRHSVLARG